MFKGFKKEFQDQLERKNQDADVFIFSFADLELVEKNNKRRKCRIISDKLSEKLHQIHSQGKNVYIPPIKFIEFNYYRNDSIFSNPLRDPIYKY